MRLKVYTMNSILNDPTFARGETEEVLQILDREVPEIFEDEIWLDYEERWITAYGIRDISLSLHIGSKKILQKVVFLISKKLDRQCIKIQLGSMQNP